MEDEDNREAFFDQLEEDDDVMPGVPEAEEEGPSKKKSDEPKKVRITKAGKPRFVLNENVLTGKNGIGTVLNHFKGTKFSEAKNSEYENLDLFLSRLESWTHQLFPKWPRETTLQKIEMLGKKKVVSNTLARIRTNDPTDDFLKSLVPDTKEDEDVVRRGDPDDVPQEPDPFEDPFYDPFDDAVKAGSKRPNEPSEIEPVAKRKEPVSITDEQRKRMEENKAKALAKKAARLAEKQRLEDEAKAKDVSSIDQSTQEESMDQSEGPLASTIAPQVTNEIPV